MAAMTEANKAQIGANRTNLFNAECAVMDNRSNAYMARSIIQENTALIQKNYSSAFMGNRQLANQNTDDLFRNRQAIIRAIPAEGAVQANFREAMVNQAKIEFLEHRSNLNKTVLDISLRMSAINAELIEVNNDVMDANEKIVEYNSQCIAKNSEFLKNGISSSSATPESNATLIAANAARIDAVLTRAN